MVVVEKNEFTSGDFYRLYDASWSGALDTLKDIARANLESEFMDFLEEQFGEDEVDATELNDFIWFERDYIYNALGLDENGDLVDGEDLDNE